MFKMDVWTCWSQFSSCYAVYIVPNCFKNHHTEFENDYYYDYRLLLIIEKLRF